MLPAGGRVAARPRPVRWPATTTPEVLASVLSTNFPARNRVASLGRLGHPGAMDLDTSALAIAPLRVEDPAAVEADFDLQRAATAVDVPDFPPPCRQHHEAQLRNPWPGRD